MRLIIASTAVALAAAQPAFAQYRPAYDGSAQLSGLVSKYSVAYGVPESLIHRVIRRESGGNARVVSRGNYGLMQIRLGTARAMGYRGSAAGLLDADTNMQYAVRYLAGAWRLSGGNEARAVRHYAAGYYYAAKRRGMPMPGAAEVYASAGPTYAMARLWPASTASDLISPASQDFR